MRQTKVVVLDIEVGRLRFKRIQRDCADVQGIGDWGHDSDGESIGHDVLRYFH